jgi:hypothetical protein
MAATIQIYELAPLGSVRGLLNEITLIDGDVPSAGTCSHRQRLPPSPRWQSLQLLLRPSF